MNTGAHDHLRHLPAVGKLLGHPGVREWLELHPEAIVTEALRQAVQHHRQRLSAGQDCSEPLEEAVLSTAGDLIARASRPSLRRVINATGIVLHTGLGRAPLSRAAVEAIREAGGGYCNLELDLQSGQRGKRVSHVRELICRLTGAPAATVVNNNAAATLLVLRTVAQSRADETAKGKRYRKRNVVVSRGQLIEIGGSYRLPEIMKAGGVQLKEVGTTNRTRIGDYEEGIDERTAALMRVHTSNYRITGFQEEVAVRELVDLGRKHALPVIDDLGSGALADLQPAGLGDEPGVRDSVAAGADLICFSGDKLLGGPQAGIILGGPEYIRAIEKSPLMRTYRVDKLVLLALEATLRLYLDEGQARREVPVLAMLFEPLPAVEARAQRLAAALTAALPAAHCEVVEEVSYAGGGTLPAEQLNTCAVRWRPARLSVDKVAARLRAADPPVVARVQKDAILFDCRTLADDDLEPLATAAAGIEQPPD